MERPVPAATDTWQIPAVLPDNVPIFHNQLGHCRLCCNARLKQKLEISHTAPGACRFSSGHYEPVTASCDNQDLLRTARFWGKSLQFAVSQVSSRDFSHFRKIIKSLENEIGSLTLGSKVSFTQHSDTLKAIFISQLQASSGYTRAGTQLKPLNGVFSPTGVRTSREEIRAAENERNILQL